MTDGVRIVGLDQAVRALQRVGVRLQDLTGATSRLARLGAAAAARFAPVRSGALRGSIRPVARKNYAGVEAGQGLRYEGPINYGWAARGIRASEFMQRADRALRPVVAQTWAEEIGKAIDKENLG